VGRVLNIGFRLQPAPPVDQLRDQGAPRNLLEGKAGKCVEAERRLHVAQAGRDVSTIFGAQDERPLRRAARHADLAELGDIIRLQGFRLRSPTRKEGAGAFEWEGLAWRDACIFRAAPPMRNFKTDR
jgi:hypothetical protein